MIDRIFIDTNILVYDYLQDDIEKHEKATNFLNGLIAKEVFISTQVLSETYSALKKNLVEDDKIKYYVKYCIEKYNVYPVTVNEVKTCLDIIERYKYSYWDCLVIASARNIDCEILYSEDMQNKQIIYSNFKIINPLI